MTTVKKSLITALSMLFALSVMFQACCHRDWSEFMLPGHNTEATSSHTGAHHHNKSSSKDSECSIHQLKNVVKPDQAFTVEKYRVSLFDIPFSNGVIGSIPNVLKNISFRLIFFNKAGPPIHLLNSVFLN